MTTPSRIQRSFRSAAPTRRAMTTTTKRSFSPRSKNSTDPSRGNPMQTAPENKLAGDRRDKLIDRLLASPLIEEMTRSEDLAALRAKAAADITELERRHKAWLKESTP